MTGNQQDGANDTTASLLDRLRGLFGGDDTEATSATEASTATTDSTTTGSADTDSNRGRQSQTPQTHSQRRLYRITPNYAFNGVTDPYRGAALPKYLTHAPVRNLSRLIVTQFQDEANIWLYTPLTKEQIAKTVAQANSTAPVTVEAVSSSESLSGQALFETQLGLTPSEEVNPRYLHYTGENLEQTPLADRSMSLATILERLRSIWFPVAFTVGIAPGVRKSRTQTLCDVRFNVELMVTDECSPERFGQIDQTLRSAFGDAPVTLTRCDTTDIPPPQPITTDALAAMTTVPAADELHNIGLVGADSPVDAPDLSLPDDYYATPLSVGWPFDSRGNMSDTPVGYSADRLPVTRLRINGPDPAGAEWAKREPPSGFLASVRDVATWDCPLFILNTRDVAFDYAQAIDDEIPDEWEEDIRYRFPSKYEEVLGQRNRCEFDPALKNRLLDMFSYSNHNYILDFSHSEQPRADVTSFLVALVHALSETPETDSVQCAVAIDAAATVLFDTVIEALPSTPELTSRATLLLNCEYPVATAAGSSAPASHRTTARQTELLETLMTEVADGTLLEDCSAIETLLDRMSLPAEVRDGLEAASALPRDEWLWYDRTAPTDDVVVGGMRSRRDTSTCPVGITFDEDSPFDKADSVTLETEFGIKKYSVDWDDYRSTTGKAFATETQEAAATTETEQSGHISSRIARPVQTDDENLPPGARFDADSDTYICQECSDRHNSTQEGLHRVCNCCSKSSALVDREALRCLPPIDLKLSPAEIEASPLSKAQLTFVRACYLSKQFAFDPVFQFDPLTDSMRHIVTDLGLDPDMVEEVLECTVDGQSIVTKQATTTPHTVYNVTATGRKQIAESIEGGIDFGPGIGDLNESTLHHIGVLYLCLYLEAEYGTGDGRTVNHYHKLQSGEIVDAVVLDEAGDIVVAAEMECHNNDVGGASSSARSTYEKLMALDSEEAIWVFETSEHWEVATDTLAEAHQDPMSDVEFRADGYSRSYISKEPALTYPGMTEAMTLSTLVTEVGYPYGLYDRDLSRFATV